MGHQAAQGLPARAGSICHPPTSVLLVQFFPDLKAHEASADIGLCRKMG